MDTPSVEIRIAALTPSMSALCDTLHLSQYVVLAPQTHFLESARDDLVIIDPAKVLQQVVAAAPTHVLCEEETQAENAKAAFSAAPKVPRVLAAVPITFEGLLTTYKDVAKFLSNTPGLNVDGDAPGKRVKAQLFDWLNNFNDRMRHKRVAILSSLDPLSIVCGYLPDLIRTCSGVAPTDKAQPGELQITLEDLAAFAPHVLIIAQPGMPLGKNVRNFSFFSQLTGKDQELWEKMPALKRGDVFFADGLKQFYNFGTGVIDTIGTLVSAMGGLDSGYITHRNSFLRLRWIELQRHLVLDDE